MEVLLGLRVVRGPDWDSGDEEDGGEGCVGTVVDHPAASRVTVQWDSGERASYRCGENGKYDLSVLDSGPTGIVHQLTCSACKASPCLFGTVWQCVRCYKYYCCTPCYLGNKHSLFHYFRRIDSRDLTQSVIVGPRILFEQVVATGIFSGAKVIRGHDWKWKNQDGGEGSRGIVVAISGMKEECARCVAEVKWPEKKKNYSYRMGRKGKVDLVLIPSGAMPGGSYCPAHLSVLGATPQSSEEFDLVAGDRIKVNLDKDLWKLMQESCGEWTDDMSMFIGQTGLVVHTDGGKTILVSYNSNFYYISVAAITKVNDQVFEVGDTVRVLEDNTEVSHLQKNHGEWNEDMAKCLGQLGAVVGLLPIGDLRVLIQGKRYIFNQACVRHGLPGETPPTVAFEEPDSRVHMQLMALEQVMSADLVPLAAAAGDVAMLEKALSNNADVNVLNCGKTALHFAGSEGFSHIVKLLLDHSPNLEVKDKERGDTPLLTAIHMGQVPCAEILIAAGASVNARNNAEEFPLYLAAVKGQYEIMKLLVKAPGVELDRQNKDGNTALLAATYAHRLDSARILVEAGADPSLFNNSCFNAFLAAAKHGFFSGIEMYLSKYPEHVDIRKVDDGHTSLMIAAVNNYQDVVYLLASKESCDLDATDEVAGHTALHLATQQGNSRVVETLVAYGTKMNLKDNEGAAPIHRAYLANDVTPFDEFTPQIKKVEKRMLDFSQKSSIPPNVTLTCFLVCNGADLDFLKVLEDQITSNHDLKDNMELIQLVAESEEALRQQDSSYGQFWGSLLRYPEDGGPPTRRQESHSPGDESGMLEKLHMMLENSKALLPGLSEQLSLENPGDMVLSESRTSATGVSISGGQDAQSGSIGFVGQDAQLANIGFVGQDAQLANIGFVGQDAQSGNIGFVGQDAQLANIGFVGQDAQLANIGFVGQDAQLANIGFVGQTLSNNEALPNNQSNEIVPDNDEARAASSREVGEDAHSADNERAGTAAGSESLTSTGSIRVVAQSGNMPDNSAPIATSIAPVETSTAPMIMSMASLGVNDLSSSSTEMDDISDVEATVNTLSSSAGNIALANLQDEVAETKIGKETPQLSGTSTEQHSVERGLKAQIPPPEDSDEEELDPNLCCLCDNPINVEFLPCGCKAICSECDQNRVKKCPTCSKAVLSRKMFDPQM